LILKSNYDVEYVKVFNPIEIKDYCAGLPFFEDLIDKRIAQMEGFEPEGKYFYDDCYNNIVYIPIKPGNRAYRNLFKKDFSGKDDFLKATMDSVEQARKFQDEVLIVFNESQDIVRKIYDSCSASGDLKEVREKIEALPETAA